MEMGEVKGTEINPENRIEDLVKGAIILAILTFSLWHIGKWVGWW